MLLSNRISDYDPKELELLEVSIREMMETLKEVDAILEAEIKEPSEPIDNVFYLDFHTFTEFRDLEKVHLPFDKIVNLYKKWTENLWEMVLLNQGNYRNHKKLMLCVVHLRQIVQTFVYFLTPPKGPDSVG